MLEKCFLAIVLRFNTDFRMAVNFIQINKKCQDVVLMLKINPLNIKSNISSLFNAEKIQRNIQFSKELLLYEKIETVRIDENLLLCFKKRVLENKNIHRIIVTSACTPNILDDLKQQIVELTVNNKFNCFNFNQFEALKKIKVTCLEVKPSFVEAVNALPVLNYVGIYCYKELNYSVIDLVCQCKAPNVRFFADCISPSLLNTFEMPKLKNDIVFCCKDYICGMSKYFHVNMSTQVVIQVAPQCYTFTEFLTKYLPTSILLKPNSFVVSDTPVHRKVCLDLSQYTFLSEIKNDVPWLLITYPNNIEAVGDRVVPNVHLKGLTINQSRYNGSIPLSVSSLTTNNSALSFDNLPHLYYLQCFFSTFNFDLNALTSLTKIHTIGNYANFNGLTNLKELTTDGFTKQDVLFPPSLTYLRLESASVVNTSLSLKKLFIRLSMKTSADLIKLNNLTKLCLDGDFTELKFPRSLRSLKLVSVCYKKAINLIDIGLLNLKIIDSFDVSVHLPSSLVSLKIEKSEIRVFNAKSLNLNFFCLYDCSALFLDDFFNSAKVLYVFLFDNNTPITIKKNCFAIPIVSRHKTCFVFP
ncbi:hypothetical protein EIN_267410 [Entamoeba invadens IP1]|uniref:Uncharacterized protein n=1 Tax=Entamoeba invadens IP1 TaxID=370355 RepID=A0A0A1UE02_ENTIV|nr:hypothetical protein EIN_267410 [Entamoeba invadens IP1]ELP91025.1 hypothetical protein EIN_267410 [Entamoeba invadens IP1]|eukprot:XP_004257796.1 hypothetical protein EIN_267410 [Entamoeba invadens IP1]